MVSNSFFVFLFTILTLGYWFQLNTTVPGFVFILISISYSEITLKALKFFIFRGSVCFQDLEHIITTRDHIPASRCMPRWQLSKARFTLLRHLSALIKHRRTTVPRIPEADSQKYLPTCLYCWVLQIIFNANITIRKQFRFLSGELLVESFFTLHALASIYQTFCSDLMQISVYSPILCLP